MTEKNKSTWEILGRSQGELCFGDSVWTIEGKALLIVMNESKDKANITVKQAEKLFKDGKLAYISDDNGFLYPM